MTRKSKREIERAVSDLEPDNPQDIPMTIVSQTVMEREKAEKRGKEILGESDAGPDGTDLVIIDRQETTVEL